MTDTENISEQLDLLVACAKPASGQNSARVAAGLVRNYIAALIRERDEWKVRAGDPTVFKTFAELKAQAGVTTNPDNVARVRDAIELQSGLADAVRERDEARAAQSSPPAGEIQGLVERAMALANAATRGPWRAGTNNGCKQIKADKDGDYRQAKWRAEVCSTPGLANEDEDAANAAFIAASRQLIPELCEAITRLSKARSCERIVRAAVKWGEAVYSVAPPGRHGDVFRVIEADPVADISCDGGPDAQGFLTSTGRFLGRIGAKQCARDAGQLLPTASKSDDLFSEDLW